MDLPSWEHWKSFQVAVAIGVGAMTTFGVCYGFALQSRDSQQQKAGLAAANDTLKARANALDQQLAGIREALGVPPGASVEEALQDIKDSQAAAAERELARESREAGIAADRALTARIWQLVNEYWNARDGMPVEERRAIDQAAPYVNQRLRAEGRTEQLTPELRRRLGLPY